LPLITELIQAIGVGEAARQSIPFIQQFAKVQGAPGAGTKLPSIFDEPVGERGEWLFNGDYQHRHRIEPGVVPQINKGQEVQAPPMGYARQGADAFQILCQVGANASNTPVWYWTGSADAENYASSLVSESPVVKLINHIQSIVTEHYQDIQGSAVEYAVAKGRFPVDTMMVCEIHCTLPSPVARNRKENQEADLALLDKELIAPQQVCTRHDLDFKEVQDLIKQAKADGWQNAAEPQEGNRQGGEGGSNRLLEPAPKLEK
jgi:hypothetical protein